MWYTNRMEDLAKYPGLYPRGNIWYVRKRIPADIRDQYPPTQDEEKWSLKTRDKQKAMQLYHQAMASIESKFQTARLKKNNPDAHDLLSTYDKGGIIGLVYNWYVEAKERLETANSTSRTVFDDNDLKQARLEATQERDGLIDAKNNNNYAVIKPYVTNWLKSKDITHNTASPAYQQFCYYFIRADIDLMKTGIAGELPKIFSNLQGGSPEPFPKPAANGFTPSKVIKISELAEKYISNDQKAGIEEKSKQPYRVLVRRMKEYFGQDLPIHEINREMLEDFRSALLQYPVHAQKKYPGKTMLQAIKLADKESNPNRLSIRSVNGQLTLITALMNYADDQNTWIFKNPAKRMSLKDPVKDKDKRDPFSTDQLNTIFQAPLYTGCVDDERNYNKPGNNQPRRARFWIPLLCLYSGLRLNEACQLEVADIERIEGVDAISVQEEGEEPKRVKTTPSIRLVPIHNELKNIGFMDFVKRQKTAGEIYLFPEVKPGAYNYKSHSFTKWFGNFIRHLEVYTPKTTFHSFRHNVRDALRNAEVPEEIANALGGWSNKGSVSGNYGKGYFSGILNKHLQKIKYNGLDLSHLYKQDGR